MTAERELTFLFTDIEGSTRLWSLAPVAMAAAVPRQEALLRAAILAQGGSVFKTVGDGLYAVFSDPAAAVRAGVDAQRALLAERWLGFPEGVSLAVRIALHTGPAEARDDDFFGPTLNRLSRTLAAGHGGQILCTDATLATCGPAWPPTIEPRDLGQRSLRDVPGSGRIFQLVAPGLPEHFPPLLTLDPRVHNLPRWPTPSIGRSDEAARLRTLLRAPDARLVTVLGTGGVGKTRLATEVGSQLLDEFQDGVRFVDLSPLRDDTQVLPAILQATAVTDHLLPPRDALLDWLQHRSLLLVLDNCEQVVDGVAATASEILTAAPNVVILATARIPIRIRAERQFALDPLPLPTGADPAPLNPAVQLFAARAREVSDLFSLDSVSLPIVHEICRMLDGIPLAIELAAPWVRILSPAALQRRLQESRVILRDGARDLPDRQRALATTIAWSYDLLDEPDRRAFRRLAVFRGGIAVDAASAVIWDSPSGDPLWALARLDALVQANLLQVSPDPTGEPRFAMLQTIQEFATDILKQSAEWDAAAAAHADFFAQLAADMREHDGTEAGAHWFERLDLELQNLDTAIGFLASTSERRISGLQVVLMLEEFLSHRNDVLQERRWLEMTYRDDADYPPELRIDALFHIGNTWHSDPAIAGEFYRRSIDVADATGEERLRIRSVSSLSSVAALEGDYETALSMAQEALQFGLRESDAPSIVDGYYRLAYISCEAGRFDQALMACEQSRLHAQEIGAEHWVAWSWVIEGRTRGLLGEPDAAVAALEHATPYFQQSGDDEAVALCHLEHALAVMDTDPATARDRLNMAATVFVATIDAYTIVATLEGGARLLAIDGRYAMAAELLGTAQRLREQTGIVATRHDAAARQWVASRVAASIGLPALEQGIERGRQDPPRAALERYLSAMS